MFKQSLRQRTERNLTSANCNDMPASLSTMSIHTRTCVPDTCLKKIPVLTKHRKASQIIYQQMLSTVNLKEAYEL